MKQFEKFNLTMKSSAIWSHSTDNGEVHSVILHDQQIYHHPKPPLAIFNDNLFRIGSSLRGAKDAAEAMLGSTSMFPFMIDLEHKIVWFPSESPANIDCVWFALHAIKIPLAVSQEETKVILHGGLSITIPVSLRSFKNRWHTAHILRSKFLDNQYSQPFIYGKPRKEITVVCDGYRVAYTVKEKKEGYEEL
ncbi:competence protein ComK [Lysinibacillus sp. KU-BSD001]|uniref:competence protein ComK n=1 Tax=Lysinibacillus sp. KU-BSD001 TaxID=3141328 RepID=UPI0036E57137